MDDFEPKLPGNGRAKRLMIMLVLALALMAFVNFVLPALVR